MSQHLRSHVHAGKDLPATPKGSIGPRGRIGRAWRAVPGGSHRAGRPGGAQNRPEAKRFLNFRASLCPWPKACEN